MKNYSEMTTVPTRQTVFLRIWWKNGFSLLAADVASVVPSGGGPRSALGGRGDQHREAAGEPATPGAASSRGESLNGPSRCHPQPSRHRLAGAGIRGGKGPLPTQAARSRDLKPRARHGAQGATRGECGPGKETRKSSRSGTHKTASAVNRRKGVCWHQGDLEVTLSCAVSVRVCVCAQIRTGVQ